MFSSITNYYNNNYSPKKLLATYLSKSLEEFFIIIDPNKCIETNLLNDTKIVLSNIAIREKKRNNRTTITGGVVERIEFSWTWDSTLLLKDVNLTIQGVTVRIKEEEEVLESVDNNNNNNETKIKKEEEKEKEVMTTTSPPTDWKAKYLQQIIDHLTLIVTDVTVSIIIQQQKQEQVVVVVQGKNMELKTLTKTTTKTVVEEETAKLSSSETCSSSSSLLQSLHLESIEAWIAEGGGGEETVTVTPKKYPILEPFGYDASIRRTSGRRFFDGLLSGLIVQGKSYDDNRRREQEYDSNTSTTTTTTTTTTNLRLHAGRKQIDVLNRLQQVLLSLLVVEEDDDDDYDDDEKKKKVAAADNKESGSSRSCSSNETEQMDEAAAATTTTTAAAAAATTTTKSTVFHLPIQSMEVILEDGTSLIRFDRCTVRYRMDGSEGSLSIGSIAKLTIPGVGKISREISGATASFGKDGFLLECDTVYWYLSSPSGNTFSSTNSEGVFDPSLLNHPIQIVANTIKIEAASNALLNFGKLNMFIKRDPFDTSVQVQVQMDTFFGDGYKGEHVSGERFNMMLSIDLKKHETNLVPQPLLIPSVGHVSSIFLTIAEVPDLHIPGIGTLRRPIGNLTLQFDNTNGIKIDCPALWILAQRSALSSAEDHNQSSLDLPCKMNIITESFQYQKQSASDAISQSIECHQISLSLEPVLAQIGTSIESPGAGLYLSCNALRAVNGSSIIEIPRLTASGLMQFSELQKIGNLVVGVDTAQLEADFSSMNWSSSLLQSEASDDFFLPFAVIPKFDMTLKYAGTLLHIDSAVIACNKFEGNVMTTLSTITAHYVAIAKQRIPYLLTRTDVVGCNLADNVGMIAGSVLTNTSIVGATLGIAARDAAGGTIAQGKAARGVSSTESYKFGDFTRGMVASVKNAAKTGTEMRGGDVYQFGDATAGSVQAAGTYASENRVRLAGATGSTAGMIAGAALLGPVGFVAGSILGASAAQSSMRAVAGDPKEEKKQHQGQSPAPQNSTNNSMGPPALQDQPSADLLSANTHDGLLLRNSGNHQQNSNSPIYAANTTSTNNNNHVLPIATSADAELIGEVASASHQVTMVQAQIMIEPSMAAEAEAEASIMASTHTQATTTTTMIDSLSSNDIIHNQNSIQERNQFPQNTMGHHQPVMASSSNTNQLLGTSHRRQPVHEGRRNNDVVLVPSSERTRTTQEEDSNHNQTDDRGGEQGGGYRFGDITRGIVARGRQIDGRDANSGYKFGDFTRGLFR